VDAIAHQAALAAGGRTIAVLGSGVDRIYPPEHRRLAERIVLQGALVSDYPLGTQPDATNFPPRNRIISGLSLAVVVVEAGEKSGALITARFAADQGREVFAVPGNIHAPQSIGTNRLIQNGAFPYMGIPDLLQTLDIPAKVQQSAARKVLPAEPNEARLLQQLSEQPLHVDELSRLCQMPVAQVSSILAILELKGLAKSVGGMNYVIAREQSEQYIA
jgi:DNA processing protein